MATGITADWNFVVVVETVSIKLVNSLKKKLNVLSKFSFKSKMYSGASTLLPKNSHFAGDCAGTQPAVRALWALVDINDQPHCQLGHSPCSAWPQALLSQTLIHQLILWHDLGHPSLLWNCAVVTGLHLSLVTLTGPGPDLLVDFMA